MNQNTMHPAMHVADVCGYSACNPQMEKNIGRQIRFRVGNKKQRKSLGSLACNETFTIVGIQRIHDGRLAYRVICDGYNDTFGRPALPSEIVWILR